MANIDYTVVQGIAGLIADFKLKDTRFVLAKHAGKSIRCSTKYFTIDCQIHYIISSKSNQ